MYYEEAIVVVHSFKYLGFDIPDRDTWNRCLIKNEGWHPQYYEFEHMCQPPKNGRLEQIECVCGANSDLWSYGWSISATWTNEIE